MSKKFKFITIGILVLVSVYACGNGTQHSIGKFVEVTVDTEFKSATLKINYSEADLDVPESTLRMHYWNETSRQWIKCNKTGVNTDENYVWATVDHLTIFTAIGYPLPDLVLSNTSLSNNLPVEGEKIKFNTTIRNDGWENAMGALILFYIFNVENGSTELLENQTINLTSNESKVLSVNWKTKKGSYGIYFIADPFNNITEGNESNNVAFITLNISSNEDGNEIAVVSEKPSDVHNNPSIFRDRRYIAIAGTIIILLIAFILFKKRK